MSAAMIGCLVGVILGSLGGAVTTALFAHKRVSEQEGIIDRLQRENQQKCTEITVLRHRLTLK